MSKKPDPPPKKPDQTLKKAEPGLTRSDVTSKKTDPVVKKADVAPTIPLSTQKKADPKKSDATPSKVDSAAKKTDVTKKTDVKKPVPSPKKGLKAVVTKFDGSSTKLPAVANKSIETVGEELQALTDSEWSASESAYSADLLNVKKAKNKVTVFAAPEKFVELPGMSVKSKRALASTTRCVKSKEEDKAPPNRVKKLSTLISNVTKILSENPKKTKGVVVSIGVKISNEQVKTATFY